MAQSNRHDAKTKVHEANVVVPVDLQIKLAKNRRDLAAVRYDLSVRRGRSWNVLPRPKSDRQLAP